MTEDQCKKGMRVRINELGRSRGIRQNRDSKQTGTVVGLSRKGPEIANVLFDGPKRPESIGLEFLDPE